MKGIGDINSSFKYLRRRSRATYMTSLISIAFVLFFIGVFASFTFFGQKFMDYAQESIYFKVFLLDGIEEERQMAFTDSLRNRPYVKDILFVSKEEAGEIMLQRTGEDVLKLTEGVNPFLASLNLKLNKDYINVDSLEVIRKHLSEEVIVASITYPMEMIEGMNRNVRIISLGGSLIGVVLIGVVLYLIFGTIRLSIYAQRLIIRSMQLIGATNAFIRKPFVISGFLQGAISGLLACGLLTIAIIFLGHWLRNIDVQNPFGETASQGIFNMFGFSYIGLFIGIVLFGALLGLTGSWVAVNRYLNRNLDELM